MWEAMAAPQEEVVVIILLVVVFPQVVIYGGDLFVWVCYPRVVLNIIFVAADAVIPAVPLRFCVVSVEAITFRWGV